MIWQEKRTKIGAGCAGTVAISVEIDWKELGRGSDVKLLKCTEIETPNALLGGSREGGNITPQPITGHGEHTHQILHAVVKVVMRSRGLTWRSQVGANLISIPHPTNLALFGHKITLYRFSRGLILLQGAQIGAGGWAHPLILTTDHMSNNNNCAPKHELLLSVFIDR